MYTEDDKQEEIDDYDSSNNVVNSYYDNYYDNNVGTSIETKGNKRNKFLIIIIILVIILAVLILLLVKSNKNMNYNNSNKLETNIVLVNESLHLKVSETKRIEYNIINDDGNIVINWLSIDGNIASVTEDGNVTALKVGVTTIIASYFINNVPYQKQCVVTVVENNDHSSYQDNEKPTLKYSLSSGENNQWTNKNVTINVNAKDNSGVVDVKYALDCVNNCNYQPVKDNKITIDKEGLTVVKIVASDRSNNSKEEFVNIKIDKTKPTVTFSPSDGTYSVGQTVTVTPSDSKSGISSYNLLISYANDREVLNLSNVTTPSYSYQFKEPGIYYFYIRVFDKAFNMCDVRSGNQWWYYQVYTIV